MADNKKNKGTLLSPTLKVGEDNVPSELRVVAYWLRYGRFQIFAVQNQKTYLFEFHSVKDWFSLHQNCPIVLPF